MSSLQLAEKLAAKAKSSSPFASPMSPQAKKLALPAKPAIKVNNENSSTNAAPPISKPVVKIQIKKHDYVPPFSRVFSDKNLFHYFERFAWERQLIAILNFIDSCKKYQEKFPSSTQKQTEKHKEIMQKLGLLPSDYVNSVIEAHDEMKTISANSFDTCLKLIMDKLEKDEYSTFIDSPHFAKWTLKYYNTEVL